MGQIEEENKKYLETKDYKTIDPACYDVLVRQGKIKLTTEEKEEIKTKARTLFFSIENTEYRSVLSHEEIERFITQDCKKISVAVYFDSKE